MQSYTIQDVQKSERAFCNNIRHLRRICKLTLQEMADCCDTSTASIQKIESGCFPKRRSLQIALACCRSFGFSLHIFMNTKFTEVE